MSLPPVPVSQPLFFQHLSARFRSTFLSARPYAANKYSQNFSLDKNNIAPRLSAQALLGSVRGEPPLDRTAMTEALRRVAYPGLTRDLVSFGMVEDVNVCDGHVTVRLGVHTRNDDVACVRCGP